MIHIDEANVEAFTQLHRDDVTIVIDELYIQLDASIFANNNLLDEDHKTNFNEEEEDDLSSDNDIDSEHEEDSKHKHSFSSNNDTDAEYESDDEFC
jgi:hypothetical protein